jgi:CRISPR-associated protein Csm5
VLHWRDADLRKTLIEAANAYAGKLLSEHRRFAAAAGMAALDASLVKLEGSLAAAQAAGNQCLLNIGWGGGLLGKAIWPVLAPQAEESHRRILAAQSVWARAIRTGMPFPKTRRVVFMQGQPAALAGWIHLSIT